MLRPVPIPIILAFLTAASCLTAAVAQTRGPRYDIRRVDFRNFSYRPLCTNPSGEGRRETLRVSNGILSRDAPEDPIRFKVTSVVYGDLTGDGRDEAFVITDCRLGGTGHWTEGFVYAMQNGRPLLASTLQGGDRAGGGIYSAKIVKGLLRVDTFAPGFGGGACCPGFVDTTTYKLNGHLLLTVGKPARREFRRYENEDGTAERTNFEPGKDAATVQGVTDSFVDYVIRARAGQTMRVSISSPEDNAEVIVLFGDGRWLDSSVKGKRWNAVLPATGDYLISVTSTRGSSNYSLEISIH
jgi:hypothetical protein